MHRVRMKGFQKLLSLSPNDNLTSGYYHDAHFTEKKTEAQRE